MSLAGQSNKNWWWNDHMFICVNAAKGRLCGPVSVALDSLCCHVTYIGYRVNFCSQ